MLTVALWVGYAFLMRDAISVSLSYFGIPARWGLQYDDFGVAGVVSDLEFFGLIVLLNSSVFISWAIYNKVMYGHLRRRRRAEPVTQAETGAFFGLTPEQVNACQAAQRIIMLHDHSGTLVRCERLGPA